jgi:hypothetical protein
MRLTPTSECLVQLSALLRTLPIVPDNQRRADFRTTQGLCRQLQRLELSAKAHERSPEISEDVFDTYLKYKRNPAHLLAVADAITACRELYTELPFGNKEEQMDFPEGALLGHLHRCCEQRDGAPSMAPSACEMCGMTAAAYPITQQVVLIEPHLLAPPESMRPGDRYSKNQFIYVCPNCHKVLHQLRPWRGDKAACQELLRQ